MKTSSFCSLALFALCVAMPSTSQAQSKSAAADALVAVAMKIDRRPFAWKWTVKKVAAKKSAPVSQARHRSPQTSAPTHNIVIRADPREWVDDNDNPRSPDDPIVVAYRQQEARISAAERLGHKQFMEGDYDGARKTLEPILQETEGRTRGIYDLVDISLRQQNFAETLALVAVRAETDGLDEHFYLRGAYAAAMLGRPADGQKQICDETVRAKIPTPDDECFPTSTGLDGIRASAALALGVNCYFTWRLDPPMPYLATARRFDRDNPIAAYVQAWIAGEQHNPQLANIYYEVAAHRAHGEFLRAITYHQ